MELYQIAGKDVLYDWLSHQSDPERRLAMLDWLVDFARDPYTSGQRVPGVRAPVFIAIVPIQPAVVVRYLVAEQFHAIVLIAIGPLP